MSIEDGKMYPGFSSVEIMHAYDSSLALNTKKERKAYMG
jgi:hypothetical protein